MKTSRVQVSSFITTIALLFVALNCTLPVKQCLIAKTGEISVSLQETVNTTTLNKAENVTLVSPNKVKVNSKVTPTSCFMPSRQQPHVRFSNRTLGFLHIPKTGGSSIEAMAARHNVSWGVCMFLKSKMCTRRPLSTVKIPGSPAWHVPIRFLPDDTLYANHDNFVVVRNPYTRAVSEYYYRCSLRPRICFGVNNERDTVERLNSEIQKFLKEALLAEKGQPSYHSSESHWIPQFDFFNDDRVQHYVSFEYMNTELPKLLKLYDLDWTLPNERSRTRRSYNHHTVWDLNLATIKLIEVVYSNDFDTFGYPMLSAEWLELVQEARRLSNRF